MSAWRNIDLDPDVFENPKIQQLIAARGEAAFTKLVRLWTWAAKNAPEDGNLLTTADEEFLERKVLRARKPLIPELVRLKLLDSCERDGRKFLAIHNWDIRLQRVVEYRNDQSRKAKVRWDKQKAGSEREPRHAQELAAAAQAGNAAASPLLSSPSRPALPTPPSSPPANKDDERALTLEDLERLHVTHIDGTLSAGEKQAYRRALADCADVEAWQDAFEAAGRRSNVAHPVAYVTKCVQQRAGEIALKRAEANRVDLERARMQRNYQIDDGLIRLGFGQADRQTLMEHRVPGDLLLELMKQDDARAQIRAIIDGCREEDAPRPTTTEEGPWVAEG